MMTRQIQYRKNKGFTLIEIMITVAIIGILSGIAVPAYNEYIVKAKIANAMVLLSDYSRKVNEYLATNGGDFSKLSYGYKYESFVRDTFDIEKVIHTTGNVKILLRGWVSSKDRYYAYAYILDKNSKPLHKDAPVMLSFWITKKAGTDDYIQVCHHYNYGKWDKPSARKFVPPSCKR